MHLLEALKLHRSCSLILYDIEKNLVKFVRLAPKSARLRDAPTGGIEVASFLLADSLRHQRRTWSSLLSLLLNQRGSEMHLLEALKLHRSCSLILHNVEEEPKRMSTEVTKL